MSSILSKISAAVSPILSKIGSFLSSAVSKIQSLSSSIVLIIGVVLGFVLHPVIKLALDAIRLLLKLL